jgi:hypothetical protein
MNKLATGKGKGQKIQGNRDYASYNANKQSNKHSLNSRPITAAYNAAVKGLPFQVLRRLPFRPSAG